MSYSSEGDTMTHINMVRSYLQNIIVELERRSKDHDKTKLETPEKEIFDIYTPKLKETTYGSDEYKQYLEEMMEGLKHHYANNRHHPEYYENGLNDMNLIDLIEMIFDWLAASKRHDNGDIFKSIEINAERFNYPTILKNIFKNTIKDFSMEKEF